MTTQNGIALVTGASTGIGAIYADRLASRGHGLILVARDLAKLEKLASNLRRAHGRQVEVLAADLCKRDDLMRVEKMLHDDSRITLLVNNAGVGGPLATIDSDPDLMSEMIALNVTALMRLSLAALPGFVARGHSTIINIASIAAVAPEILNGVYGGTKAFVLAFSQNLKKQLEGKGVHVQVVLPGATATEFWDSSGTPLQSLPPEIVMSATEMVDAALAGLDMGEFATIPALPQAADWDAYERARQALGPLLSNKASARRYGIDKSA